MSTSTRYEAGPLISKAMAAAANQELATRQAEQRARIQPDVQKYLRPTRLMASRLLDELSTRTPPHGYIDNDESGIRAIAFDLGEAMQSAISRKMNPQVRTLLDALEGYGRGEKWFDMFLSHHPAQPAKIIDLVTGNQRGIIQDQYRLGLILGGPWGSRLDLYLNPDQAILEVSSTVREHPAINDLLGLLGDQPILAARFGRALFTHTVLPATTQGIPNEHRAGEVVRALRAGQNPSWYP